MESLHTLYDKQISSVKVEPTKGTETKVKFYTRGQIPVVRTYKECLPDLNPRIVIKPEPSCHQDYPFGTKRLGNYEFQIHTFGSTRIR